MIIRATFADQMVFFCFGFFFIHSRYSLFHSDTFNTKLARFYDGLMNGYLLNVNRYCAMSVLCQKCLSVSFACPSGS